MWIPASTRSSSFLKFCSPIRHRTNLPGRLKDAFSLEGAYDIEALISVVKEFVRQSVRDEEAPMLSPEKRYKV